MATGSIGFSRDELIKALQSASRATPGNNGYDDAKTVRELEEELGTDRKKVREWLRPLVQSHAVEIVRVHRERIDGVVQRVPAYRLVRPEAGALN